MVGYLSDGSVHSEIRKRISKVQWHRGREFCKLGSTKVTAELLQRSIQSLPDTDRLIQCAKNVVVVRFI